MPPYPDLRVVPNFVAGGEHTVRNESVQSAQGKQIPLGGLLYLRPSLAVNFAKDFMMGQEEEVSKSIGNRFQTVLKLSVFAFPFALRLLFFPYLLVNCQRVPLPQKDPIFLGPLSLRYLQPGHP